MTEVNRMQKSYGKISRAHKRIGYTLGYPAKLKRLAETVNKNTLVANDIAVSARQKADYPSPSLLQGASDSDLRDVREALRHFVRDWSGDGAQERSSVLGPILEILSNVPEDRRGSLEVLVPGSGLGRLAWEISKLGMPLSTMFVRARLIAICRLQNISERAVPLHESTISLPDLAGFHAFRLAAHDIPIRTLVLPPAV